MAQSLRVLRGEAGAIADLLVPINDGRRNFQIGQPIRCSKQAGPVNRLVLLSSLGPLSVERALASRRTVPSSTRISVFFLLFCPSCKMTTQLVL